MIEQKYPIGMQTFSELIEKGYTYVDRTGYIKPLLSHGKYIFLSRPRRFGKSLLLSTLKSYFEGRRYLFGGLAADSMDLDWTPSPVLRFDFNSEDFSAEQGLERLLNRLIGEYEKEYGMTDLTDTLAGRFAQLIRRVAESTGRNVVILVDEYDKPLLAVEENKVLLEKNQQILKSIFGNLKTMDEYIRFAFITGVARFTKVSIFSDLNNLKDISMDNAYAGICGWTEDELIANFGPGIRALADERDEDFESTIIALRNYYDGYMFTSRGPRLYNPFSILNALAEKDIKPFWFVTGTPTFLARRVRENGLDPEEINGVMSSEDDLVSVGMDSRNPVPLMFQTGYLSIESYDRESQLYTLRLPNKEVEIGFYKSLLRLYAPLTAVSGSQFDFTRFKSDLVKGRIYDFIERLSILLKDLPVEDHRESTYRAVTYLIAVLCGTRAIAEHHGYKGRSDMEVATAKYVYLFEFKYNKSAGEAMEQIRSRDYAGRYALDRRSVYLIGANFNENKEKRGLEYEIEMLK